MKKKLGILLSLVLVFTLFASTISYVGASEGNTLSAISEEESTDDTVADEEEISGNEGEYEDVQEVTGPALESIDLSYDGETITKDTELTFTYEFAEAQESDARVTSINIVYEYVGDNSENLQDNRKYAYIGFEVNNINETKATIADNAESSNLCNGEWMATSVAVYYASDDEAYGDAMYTHGTAGDEGTVDLSNLRFVFSGGTDPTDTEGPTLTKIEVLQPTEDNPTDVEIYVTAKDGINVTGVSYSLSEDDRCDDGLMGGRFDKIKESNEGDVYLGMLDMESQYAKTQYFYSVTLVDSNNNIRTYTYEDVLEMYIENGDTKEEAMAKLDKLNIKPYDQREDDKAPEVTAFSYESTEITAPDVITATLNVKEEGSGIGYVQVGIRDTATTYDPNNYDGDYEVEAATHIKDDGTVVVEIAVGRYKTDENGETINSYDVYIYNIMIRDKAGNDRTYIYNVESGKFYIDYNEEDSVKLIDSNRATVISEDYSCNMKTYITSEGIIKDDIVEAYNAFSDGSGSGEFTVLCDTRYNTVIPAQLFTDIQGKNITVIFENTGSLYSETAGVQWIINGQDIKEEYIKDVDTYIEFYVLTSSAWYDLIELEEIELSPDTGMTELEQIEVITNALAEYFDKLKEFDEFDGVDVDKYKAKAIKYYKKYTGNVGMRDAIEAAVADDEIIQKTNYLKMLFAENGQLPGEFTVKFKPTYAFRYHALNVNELFMYYISEDGRVDETDSSNPEINKQDGYVELKVSHNSEFWLADGSIATIDESDDDTSDTPNEDTDQDNTGDDADDDSGNTGGNDDSNDNDGTTDGDDGTDTDASNTETNNATGTTIGDAASTDKAVKTSDDFNMTIPFALAGLALAGMAVAVATRKRHN